jgi:hypothetical protein
MQKLKTPFVVGVPEIVAVGLDGVNVRPVGRVPERVNVYDPVPPLAVTVSLYGTPTTGTGSVGGESVSAHPAGLIKRG